MPNKGQINKLFLILGCHKAYLMKRKTYNGEKIDFSVEELKNKDQNLYRSSVLYKCILDRNTCIGNAIGNSKKKRDKGNI